ncbi:MAG: hypothetical protein CME24_18720 [Gemmatimonadetes bacterium]|nr:hypothetical protein [Gemmatimonadota bacterium]
MSMPVMTNSAAQGPWTIIANAYAGRGRARQAVERCSVALGKAGIETNVLWGHAVGQSTEAAKQALADDTTTIVIAGGDGTINEVLQAPIPAEVPIGFLPSGSGNDLCRAVGIPTGPEAIDILLAGHSRRIDLVGCGERRFVTVAAVGLDAEVSEAKLTGRVRLPGTIGYVWTTLKTLATYRPRPLRLEGDFGRIESSCWLVATANTASYGGGIQIAPDAQPTDGLLDIVIVDGSMSRLSIMRLLPRALRGRHIGNAAVRVERTSWLRVESLDGVGQVLHADGERLAHTPAMLQVIPEALTVLAPRPLDP